MPLPTPPPDLSGGILIFGYQSSAGGPRHRGRVHVVEFSPVPTGSGDYSYGGQPLIGGTTGETTVGGTFAALAAVLAPFYDNTWTFAVDGLMWVPQAGNDTLNGVVQPHGIPISIGAPSPATVPGSGAVATTAFQQCVATIFNHRTLAGLRARLNLFGVGGVLPQPPFSVAPASGGSTVTGTNLTQTIERALVNYLSGGTGTASAIVGHNNTRWGATGRVTFAYNRRVRRRLGFA